ncbi:hypothetical protein F5X68DRAFT_4234 [Plectosphaerella plurivora]|uniref:Uncharacterized protein n=1 Tax=Plectosphaerella plurivora TaxID=936078 RepID=A0A9P8VMW5_9PEZI|nr:hypothetical protein F5X68DRAFT_4234 [Plectosphaerella plurivora]
MRSSILASAALAATVAAQSEADFARNFTISNGQIYTPGLAIVNAPQPGTPMGGDDLHISLDVSSNGKLPLPPYADDSATAIHNITLFLSSYRTGRNFTISNGTATADNSTYGDIMLQEEGSTVKHLNWVWPDCLVGDGQPENDDSDRGLYNISIRQNFRLNDEDHYTIFDLPIMVTNSIPESGSRPSCDELNNPLISYEDLGVEEANALGFPTAPGEAVEIEVTPKLDGAASLGRWGGAVWMGVMAVAYLAM